MDDWLYCGGMGIVKELKTAIEADGRSVNALARAADLSPIQLSRFIRGKRGVNIETADRLCEALGLELRPKQRKGK
jgi:plasmid maintenance system antidote protein VapI